MFDLDPRCIEEWGSPNPNAPACNSGPGSATLTSTSMAGSVLQHLGVSDHFSSRPSFGQVGSPLDVSARSKLGSRVKMSLQGRTGRARWLS